MEVAPEDCPGTPRLHITEGNRSKYTALSYCWGVEPYGPLNMSNVNEYTRQSDVKSLSQTFQDAIVVAKAMFIPYLWVDALYIIQDSEQEKIKEISMMERIYGESLITIVAASSENAIEVFLQPRDPTPDSHVIPFRLAKARFGSMSILELDAVEYREMLEPINTRAWTLQEQLIPNRSLIYASHILQWRCNAGVQNPGRSLHCAATADREKYCETLLWLRRPAAERKDQFTRWLRIIHVYPGHMTSLATDKLIALAGIAKEFSKSLSPGYYAGLWEYMLLLQLT